MSHLILELILYLFLGSVILFNPKSSLAATIKLVIPPSVKFNQEFNVEVYLETKSEKTIGTDLLINYDPKNYTFIKAIPGNLYPVYHPAKIYSEKNNIRYSGTNNYNNYKTANGLFTTLVFSSKITTKPEINLQWEKNKTNDTNIIGVKGEDLLITNPIISYSKNLTNILKKNPETTNESVTTTGVDQFGDVLGEIDTPPTYQDTHSSTSNLLNSNYPKVAGASTIRRLTIFIVILASICLISLGFVLFLISKKKREKEDQK